MMLGCHSCKNKPEPGTPYEASPCAACRTGKNPPPVARTDEDPAAYQSMSVLHPALVDDGEGREESLSPETVPQLLRAFSESVRILVRLKERHPLTYRILDAKMQNPCLSYTDLAARFSCRKQNVQYHLKRAVEVCPALSHVLIIDSRFSLGYSVLKHSRRRLRRIRKAGAA